MRLWGAWQEAHDRMVSRHRLARERLAWLQQDLHQQGDDDGHASEAARQQRIVAEKASSAAQAVASGWLGDPWSSIAAGGDRYTLGQHLPDAPGFVRIGEGRPVDGATFPMVVPLLEMMHLAIDAPVRDSRVAGLFQSVLTRILAAVPPGDVRVVACDPAGLGRVWAPYRELIETGIITEVTDLEAALAAAEEQVRQARDEPGTPRPHLVLALGGLPAGFGGDHQARLLALAHAGIAAKVYLMVAEWPPKRPGGYGEDPELDTTTQLTAKGRAWEIGNPVRVEARFNFPVVLDPAPPAEVIRMVCGPLAARARADSELSFAELLADPPWQESSADGLSTPVGRKGRTAHVVRFDDATPHWLVGGRSGSGKTIFLLDVLAGLTVRYSPAELALYLLDFKEGVSFVEFTPTPRDPTWIPQAVAVGVESDREYGVAVLRALKTEMGRRAGEMKRAGVSRLADLRTARPDLACPRILAVIDEFQVLFAGNDALAQQAVDLLEEVARKGRSYGVHMVLASQTMSGIPALYTKTEAIFGQFPMRVALAGGGGILDLLNKAADTLTVGTAIINTEAGAAEANTVVRLPYAEPAAVAELRHRLWEHRPRGNPAPAVFVGYNPAHLHDDPSYARLSPKMLRRSVLVGRCVDVGSPTASVVVDATPGRHLAVVGPSTVGADILHAAVASLARQHEPGGARFLLAPLVPAADDAATAAAQQLQADRHDHEVVPLDRLGATLAELSEFTGHSPQKPTYLVLFGADAASPVLAVVGGDSFRTGADNLRIVIQQGPLHGVHVLGWWRGLARFSADVGTNAREDIACLVVLNVPGEELKSFLGQYDLNYAPRRNRALLLDRHAGTATLIVPFVRPGRIDEDEL